jgi:hypothetical protein
MHDCQIYWQISSLLHKRSAHGCECKRLPRCQLYHVYHIHSAQNKTGWQNALACFRQFACCTLKVATFTKLRTERSCEAISEYNCACMYIRTEEQGKKKKKRHCRYPAHTCIFTSQWICNPNVNIDQSSSDVRPFPITRLIKAVMDNVTANLLLNALSSLPAISLSVIRQVVQDKWSLLLYTMSACAK